MRIARVGRAAKRRSMPSGTQCPRRPSAAGSSVSSSSGGAEGKSGHFVAPDDHDLRVERDEQIHLEREESDRVDLERELEDDRLRERTPERTVFLSSAYAKAPDCAAMQTMRSIEFVAATSVMRPLTIRLT
jgi:hypothetical protein